MVDGIPPQEASDRLTVFQVGIIAAIYNDVCNLIKKKCMRLVLDDCMIGINVEVWACPQYKGAVFPDMEISMIKIRRYFNNGTPYTLFRDGLLA